ncbi:MAG TPA: hypothetical protein ENJ80_13140 [Gammaproteobacteria bacterium]|nr:hypothetical protein [Gammaproteobacteria bacterium]
MAIATAEIEKYLVQVGYESTGGAGGPKSRGVIACYGRGGYTFLIYLAAPGSATAPPVYNASRKIGSINVPVDEMSHYVDILRNEKPLYMYMNSEKPQWNHIRTSKEPVGEGDQ